MASSRSIVLPILPPVTPSTHAQSAVYRTTNSAGTPKVLLISMPWASLTEPSLGLAILKAKLLGNEIPCTIRHQNIFFLEYLKAESYDAIGARWGFNDFLFTKTLQEEVVPEQLEALVGMVHNNYRLLDLQGSARIDPEPFIEYALKIRNEAVPRFLADCMRVVDESDATMIGFTCMYDQTFASLALAKLIKEKYPEKLIVFGGYALERPVGPQIFSSFPFVDVVVFGESEEKIVPLAQGSVERDNLRYIPNILFRDSEDRVHQTPPLSKPINLDESPIPEYDDFFSDVAELKSHHQVEIEVQTLPVESSRGCWWGQISHCTFCGIDDETMKYRSKSPERVKLILSTLKARHGPRVFRFADYILPRQYYKTLLPELAQDPSKYFLHWEMKANVKCKDIEIMSLAGVVAVQPGIESFSTSVLKKMCKGVSGIQNVYTIKTLMEHNISVNYNILFGFPTDTPSEYRELINQIPYLYHLIAPYSYIPVQTTRFAPLQTDPERFGITKPIVSERAYDMILAPDYRRRIGFDLNNYCYIFETPYEFNPDCAELYNVLVYQVSHWIQLHESREPRLSYEVTESGIEYFDSRYDEKPKVWKWSLDHARLQNALSQRIVTWPQLTLELQDEMKTSTVAEILEDFVRERLIYQEGNQIVGLAFPAACYKKWEELRKQPLLENSTPDREITDQPSPPQHCSCD